MGTLHDPSSRLLAEASGSQGRSAIGGGGKDVLSDVLRAIKLTGALFFGVNASSPWSVEVPHGHSFTDIILPRAQHVISYHIVTRGSGWVRVGDLSPVQFLEGDILVIPHQDPYAMHSAMNVQSGLKAHDSVEFFRAMMAGQLPSTVTEGGGGLPQTKYVCGFLGCDATPFNPLLGALPRLMRLRRGTDDVSVLLDSVIDLTLGETSRGKAGAECVRLRLSELMFVEVIRLYLEALPAEQTGWLAGLREPVVGRALALLHEMPAHGWTLDELSAEVGVSRSVLAARFTTLLGCPPMQYLTRWRVQIAARMLIDGTAKVAAVGRDVGYESEAAFSRAFKRVSGVSPAEWRAVKVYQGL